MRKGAFQVARKLFESEIWLDKPLSWIVIWIFILGRVNHESNDKFQRGEGFFNFHLMVATNQLGKHITLDMVKKAIKYFKGKHMVTTHKSTRGMRIKVLNYHTYQTLDNYRSTSKSTLEAPEKHQDKQELKNEKKNTSVATATHWDWNNYLKEMSTDKRKHIRIIASYLGRRKKTFKSQPEASEAVKRHLRAAISVSKFERDDIVNAMNKCDKMEDIDYTLETVLKVLTK